MSEPHLLFTVKEHIATITLNRPEKLNPFSVEMLELWKTAWTLVSANGTRTCEW